MALQERKDISSKYKLHCTQSTVIIALFQKKQGLFYDTLERGGQHDCED